MMDQILKHGGKKIILVIFLIIIALSCLAIEFFIYDKVDRCLDSGGSFNYETDTCVYK